MKREDEMIPLETAARLASVSIATIRRAAARKTLKARKIGRNWVTTPAAVEAWKADDLLHKPGPKK